MNTVLTEEERALQMIYKEYADERIRPHTLEIDKGLFSVEPLLKEMHELGFCGIVIPKEYGGLGSSYVHYVLAVEELSKASGPVAKSVSGQTNMCFPILHYGTEEQKRNYVIPVAKGEKILVFALTEPGAGSDAGGTLTSAVQAGDEFILNGRKTFISGAPFADYAVVYAKTDPSQKGSKGISMFLVDMKLPGVSCGKPEHKMGIVGYPTSDIILEDVHVHKSDLLGPLHKGFSTAMKTLDGGRLGMAAQAVGIAQGCLDASVKYAKERKQFGKPIAKFQAISFMLADMATEIEAARQLVYSTAVRKDAGDPESAKLCAMSKLYAAEMCNRAAYKAVQIHGGYGYIKEYKVERFYRDARITSIYEGTSQVQQMVISGSLLK